MEPRYSGKKGREYSRDRDSSEDKRGLKSSTQPKQTFSIEDDFVKERMQKYQTGQPLDYQNSSAKYQNTDRNPTIAEERDEEEKSHHSGAKSRGDLNLSEALDKSGDWKQRDFRFESHLLESNPDTPLRNIH